MYFLKRHLPQFLYNEKKIEFTLKTSLQFHKIEVILYVSFEDTPSTIFILVTYQKN